MEQIALPPGEAAEEPGRITRLNFSPAPSPFVKAERREKRIKLFLWGASGSGKTTLALQFPKPVVIDMERGTEHYGEKHSFDVLHATSADDVIEAVRWLLQNKHEYLTLVLDPITIFWEALQKKWSETFLKRNKQSKGYKFEFYDFQPKDWATIKGELKEFVRYLLALDMHVVVTARAKPLYEEGSLMRAVGETFDGEKGFPYSFDTILRLYREGPAYMAEPIKDRTGKLPAQPFVSDFKVFDGFGKLTKKAEPVKPASQAQKDRILELARLYGLTEEKVRSRLESYGAETLEDLTKQAAEVIIQKLEAALAGSKGLKVEEGREACQS